MCICVYVFYGEQAITHHKFGGNIMCICVNVYLCFPVCSTALKFILNSFRVTQNKERLIWNFKGTEYNLKIPIMFIIGDTKGHDKLVGRYTNYVYSKSLVRDCKCLRSNGDVLNQNCELINANEIRDLIRLDRIESFRALRHYLFTKILTMHGMDLILVSMNLA